VGSFDGYEHADLRLLVFASGMSNVTDVLALTKARHPIGAVAGLLRTPGHAGESTRAMGLLVDAISSGIPAFVDSGAFNAFRSGETLDWQHVLGVYRDLGEAIPVERRHLLSVVMPDIVGDQAGTLALQRTFEPEIRVLQDMGLTTMLAIQRGERDPVAVYRDLVEVFGDRFVAALPCNERAFSNDAVLDFASRAHPPRLHLLGRVRESRRILSHLTLFAPDTVVSADANRLRAKVGEGRPLTMNTRAAIGDRAQALAEEAYTDEVYDLLHTPKALSPAQAESLARTIGVTDVEELSAWRTLSQSPVDADSTDDQYGSGLGSLLHLHFRGQEQAMVNAVWRWSREHHRRSVAPSIRAEHVAAAFRRDLAGMHADDRAEECAHGHARRARTAQSA
jgi:hypothetical protein